MAKIINLGVLISGSGRTLQNFIDLIAQGKLPARVAVVISSNPEAYGLERARKHHIPAFVINRKDFKSMEEFSAAITQKLKEYPVDLVTLAGFLHLYKVPPEFKGKVLNIHPALLSKYGGKGYYGERVHRAVLAAGEKISGCTVHFADNVYDHGAIVVQRQVPVKPDDTPETLADRVFQEECLAYPEAIRLFAEGNITVHSNEKK